MARKLKQVPVALQTKVAQLIIQHLLWEEANATDFGWLAGAGGHFATTLIEEVCRTILIETTLRTKKEYRVRVNYAADVVALAKKCGIGMNHLDHVKNSCFRTGRRGSKIVTIVLEAGYDCPTAQLLRMKKKRGFRAALIHELLAFVRQYPIPAFRLHLVALGSPFKGKNPIRSDFVKYPCTWTLRHEPYSPPGQPQKPEERIRKLLNDTDYPGCTWKNWHILLWVKE